MTKNAPVSKKPKAELSLVMTCWNQVFKESGNDVKEILSKLPMTRLKTKAVFVFTRNGRSFQFTVPPALIRRLAVNKLSQELMQKRVEIALR